MRANVRSKRGMGVGASMIRILLALTCAAAVCGFAATAAQAAAQLELSQGAPPSTLAPGQGASTELTFTNTGDATVATDAATITVDLPDVRTASGEYALRAAGVNGGSPWPACAVDSAENEIVCTGPATTIPAGASGCMHPISFFGVVPCPIGITVEADADAPSGSYETTIEACVTGAPPCVTSSATTVIREFGDDFGIAPINGPDSQAVPALPGESHAFWAGTCRRASAPSFGAPIPGGVGVRPDTIIVPTGNNLVPQTTALAPAMADHCIDRGGVGVPGHHLDPWSQAPAWRLAPATQAGGHPDGSAVTYYNKVGGNVDGTVDNIRVDLPPGFAGDPTAVPKCTAAQFAVKPPECPAQTQVGVLHLYLVGIVEATYPNLSHEEVLPVYNLEPREGNVAELGIPWASGENVATVRIVAKARTNDDFGVTTFAGQIPAPLPLMGQTITIWGVPWATSNDVWRPKPETIANREPGDGRGHIGFTGVPADEQAVYHPSWGSIRPFLTNITGPCNGRDPVTRLFTDQYRFPGAFTSEGYPDLSDPDWKRYDSRADAVTGCEKVPFDPDIGFGVESASADAPTGLSVDLDMPQNDDPLAAVATNPSDGDGAPAHWNSDAGIGTSHLDKSVVTLPDGVSVNPSSAAGLAGCTDAQIGLRQLGNPNLFNDQEPACPAGSKIGTVAATTPLLEGSPNLAGDVILGAPKSTDPTSGEMLRMFLVLRNKERGLLAKVYGSAVADPQTGQLTATFDENPKVPVENISLEFKGGQRGVLAMPPRCGAADRYRSVSSFTPWSRSHLPAGDGPGTQDPVNVGQAWLVNQACAYGFAPALQAGMSNGGAREHGTFSFKFTRPQGDQSLRGLTAVLPKGLLASVRGVALCSNAQAGAGACPAGSKIGVVDAKAGSGDPFVLERKGEVFLTEGYKGGPYGLAVKVRPVAGPFRGAMELSPIVVRQAIHVDRRTAQVTAVSDPFPLIHHGVPLRVREVTVLVDRGDFMLNPSDCSPKQVQATILSAEGTRADVANHFQASNCADLRFKPRLNLRLTGRRQVRTGRHPGVRAVVRQQGIGEAGIEKAVVRLPKSLALDVDNAQALCEFADGTKPDLENHCPKGSIVGRARAKTPLLNDDLVGNVYFVKNVRIDKDTGNEIRTLPMIIVALRGEIAVNLVGESNTTKSGKLVNTFDEVPDAPVSRFNLNIRGGKNGILAVTRTRRANINLCAKPRSHVAEADMDGQNGRRHDFNVRMKTPCRKRRQSAARVCRKRTNSKPALRRCVRRVKANRAKAAARRAAAKRRAGSNRS